MLAVRASILFLHAAGWDIWGWVASTWISFGMVRKTRGTIVEGSGVRVRGQRCCGWGMGVVVVVEGCG